VYSASTLKAFNAGEAGAVHTTAGVQWDNVPATPKPYAVGMTGMEDSALEWTFTTKDEACAHLHCTDDTLLTARINSFPFEIFDTFYIISYLDGHDNVVQAPAQPPNPPQPSRGARARPPRVRSSDASNAWRAAPAAAAAAAAAARTASATAGMDTDQRQPAPPEASGAAARLQHVCKVLQIQSSGLAQPTNYNPDTIHNATASECLALISEYNPSAAISLHSLWAFVDVVYWQLCDLNDRESVVR
jgi:hypothetical protein